eukprot:CAMPEP_0198236912 /NCGR_PEP_ID=MMETSP1446-20131203/2808_1 /TAXON_ID=1461542 ORGANISM="Unidentified sp, Strain CCMP2111" /NCGR_SAMPLE_ID=MMETSP1446 /ASSEMBLY_ACC=CAM_ASM_001112 /LENGTH=187 /DNA_ID=CAMNT_0043918889 /DNA_START=233 /DNA_END=798 /DNA_ORIENTATION=-
MTRSQSWASSFPYQMNPISSSLRAAAIALDLGQLFELLPNVWLRCDDLFPELTQKFFRFLLGDLNVRIAPRRRAPRPAMLLQQVQHPDFLRVVLLVPFLALGRPPVLSCDLPLVLLLDRLGLFPLGLPRRDVDVVPRVPGPALAPLALPAEGKPAVRASSADAIVKPTRDTQVDADEMGEVASRGSS